MRKNLITESYIVLKLFSSKPDPDPNPDLKLSPKPDPDPEKNNFGSTTLVIRA